jgi:hypothetical protein
MKIVPDSRIPRRLPTISSRISPVPMRTRSGYSSGTIDVSAATPAETDTATVTM